MRAQMAAKLGDEGPVIGHVREHLQGDDDIEAAPSKSKPMKSPATNLTSGARPRTSWDRSVPVTWPNLVNCGQSQPAPQPTSRIGDRSDAAHPAIRNDLGLPSGHLVERLLAVRGIPLVPEDLLQGNRCVASHAVTPGRGKRSSRVGESSSSRASIAWPGLHGTSPQRCRLGRLLIRRARRFARIGRTI